MTENIKIVCIFAALILIVIANMTIESHKSRQVLIKMYCHEHQMKYDYKSEDCVGMK